MTRWFWRWANLSVIRCSARVAIASRTSDPKPPIANGMASRSTSRWSSQVAPDAVI